MASNEISVELRTIIGISLFFTHILDDDILKRQNNNDKLFVLLFRYNRNIKINRPTTDNDVAV